MIGVFRAAPICIRVCRVQHADIVATNGVVHTVDRVLMPPVRH
ncbi:MAG TPA: fasciclin domain-containing protein [Ramlibacter sp.]|nr:fasciclin domain-containing protein [Ramlibacter sp.]